MHEQSTNHISLIKQACHSANLVALDHLSPTFKVQASQKEKDTVMCSRKWRWPR